MKKLLRIGVIMVLMASFVMTAQAGIFSKMFGKKKAKKDSSMEQAQAIGDKLFADIEPLSEKLELSVGANNSAQAGFMTHLVEKLGGFEKANLDVDLHIFDNGPVNVEAMAAGETDITGYGLGGTLSGTIGQDFVNIAAANWDFYSLMFFAPNDSDIVKAGKNVPEHAGLYGTAEEWRGKEIFLPLGTNMHYVLYEGLKALGVDPSEIKMTHMNVPNVNTALRAGKADVGGVWTNFSFGTLNDIATPVLRAGDFDIPMAVTIQTRKDVLAKPEKREAIKKWMELYYMAIDWVYESEENTKLAVDWYVSFNKGNGVSSTVQEISALVENDRWLTLDQNLEMINTMSDKGDFNKYIESNVEPLKFFVKLGNYTEADLEKFVQPQYYDFSIIRSLRK